MKILRQGAEAIIYSETLDGEAVIVKERTRKRYRIRQIDDRLRLTRMRQEMKLMRDARGVGIMTPKIVSSDEGTCRIFFEDVRGELVKDAVSKKSAGSKIFLKIGEGLGKMHSHGIIHGDLTTSNMILRGGDVYFIDFGLGRFSRRVEDMATDLSVLAESLNASHHRAFPATWRSLMRGYASQNKSHAQVESRMEKIEGRARYRKRD